MTKKLAITPWFDMELFMTTSQESRMGGEVMERLMRRFDEWAPHVNAHSISLGDEAFVLVHLDEQIEQAIDEAWKHSPSEAFRLNALAQTLCMTAVNDLVPEVQDAGCAPSPKATPELAKTLQAVGVPYTKNGPTLSRRFAVLTPAPFRGGCETCALLRECPKGQGHNDMQSVVLPGFELNT